MRTSQLWCVAAAMVGFVAWKSDESNGTDPMCGVVGQDEGDPQRDAAAEEPALIPLTVNRTGPEPPPAVAPFDAEQARKHQEAWAKHLGLNVEWTNSIGIHARCQRVARRQGSSSALRHGPSFTVKL